MKKKENLIVDKSMAFALEIISAFKYIQQEQKEYIMSKQLLRSGTAVGALITEAQNAESKKDFIHKLAIAQKECAETSYWLILLNKSAYLENDMFSVLNNECQKILKILRSIILSSKRHLEH